MKKLILVTVGLVLCFGAIPLIGSASRMPAFQGSQDTTCGATKTFTGTVRKQGDFYILSDKGDKTNYELEDLKQPNEYEGNTAKVIGTLDAENWMIYVQSIVEIA